MGDDLYLQFIFIVCAGFILGLYFFYSAYRIQKQRGVVIESKIVFVLMLLISIVPFFYVGSLGVDPFIMYGVVIGILVVGLLSRFYFNGKEVTIYETTKESVVSLLNKELTQRSIPYEIKGDFQADETIFDLYEGKAKIKVEAGILGEERKNIKISFKRWWSTPQVDEVQYRIMEVYRKDRDGELFWKQILLHCILGFGIILAIGYFALNMNPRLL
ncbi:hypothetical protein [Desertibacillus haloalkaliphilus]|uniref:hypothetical protein n=1 Tax=Desertibacillus haloalkaliphilus TaxID=1328930 RepID=UPI001C267ACA|nr:hypothetical protein [Desertibacillus haloalkaliphilus]MBU8906146.1 hypothetical protein [Desertibacillus haloalkaliphilus]